MVHPYNFFKTFLTAFATVTLSKNILSIYFEGLKSKQNKFVWKLPPVSILIIFHFLHEIISDRSQTKQKMAFNFPTKSEKNQHSSIYYIVWFVFAPLTGNEIFLLVISNTSFPWTFRTSKKLTEFSCWVFRNELRIHFFSMGINNKLTKLVWLQVKLFAIELNEDYVFSKIVCRNKEYLIKTYLI